MGVTNVFARTELKYRLTAAQDRFLRETLAPYVEPDQYGESTICNIYYDTPDFRLIRKSIEKPVYKEKLRIRSYERATTDSTVFVELKKKYKHVVYKRRLSLSNAEATAWLAGEEYVRKHTQIENEIEYFRGFYGSLHPTIFLSYEREAYYTKDGSDFRVTFDDTVLCRQEELSLTAPIYGTPILPEGKVLMEIKCSGGIPLWMTAVLSREKIFKTSFSKYGTAYQTLIFPQIHTHSIREVPTYV